MKKTFVKGIWIKEKTFTDWSVLKTSIKVDDLIKFLEENKNEKGYVNFDIKKRKQASETGITHNCELDTWKPDTSQSTPESKTKNSGNAEPEDDFPF